MRADESVPGPGLAGIRAPTEMSKRKEAPRKTSYCSEEGPWLYRNKSKWPPRSDLNCPWLSVRRKAPPSLLSAR
jgi:hypothetical protein